ncbi:hypothetical protein AAGT00_28775 [Streptomyces cavourensis]
MPAVTSTSIQGRVVWVTVTMGAGLNGTKYFAVANALVSIAAGLGTAYLTAAFGTMVLR